MGGPTPPNSEVNSWLAGLQKEIAEKHAVGSTELYESDGEK
jgi:hypothetical protein